jgi:glucan phosphorylase
MAGGHYRQVSLYIFFMNSLLAVVNNDPEIGDRLKIVYVENYRVSLAEKCAILTLYRLCVLFTILISPQ